MENSTDIFEVIEEMERYFEEAKKVPLTNQYIVDRAAVLNMLQMMRDSLPEAIKNASRITSQEGRILQDAKKHYENLSAEADAKAQKLRMESEQRAQALVNDATHEANRIMADAQRQAEVLVDNAEREAKERVSQTKIALDAEQKASEMLANARSESQRLRLMALDHCAELFKRCENEAITIANELRDARIQLDQDR